MHAKWSELPSIIHPYSMHGCITFFGYNVCMICDGMCRDKLKGSGRIGLKRGREKIRVQASVFSLLLVVVHGLAALRPT